MSERTGDKCALVLDTLEQRVVLKSLVALGAHVTDNVMMAPEHITMCLKTLDRYRLTAQLVMKAVGQMGET